MITDLLDTETDNSHAEAIHIDAPWGYRSELSLYLWAQGVTVSH